MEVWIQFDLIILFCVIVIAAIGVWALVRKTPMHFWSGTTVDPGTISDIKAYNRANAAMWFCYCVPLIASMVAAPFSILAASIIMVAGAVAGLPALIFTYGKIKKRYSK